MAKEERDGESLYRHQGEAEAGRLGKLGRVRRQGEGQKAGDHPPESAVLPAGKQMFRTDSGGHQNFRSKLQGSNFQLLSRTMPPCHSKNEN